MSAALVVALLGQAKAVFGEPGTWNEYEVAQWLQRRVREVREGTTLAQSEAPREFPRAVERDEVREAREEREALQMTQWDEFGEL